MLAAFVALVLFFGGGFAMLMLTVAMFSFIGKSAGPRVPTVPSGAYLVVNLDTHFRDAPAGPPEFTIALLGGGNLPRTMPLRRALDAIRTAANDERIRGVVILGGDSATGLAERRELRAALADFKDSGKPIRAYLSLATTGQYYLASVADDIALDPFGFVAMPGLASQGLFFKNAFEKLGVGVQVTRVGKYKSAVEPFTSDGFSEENREQVQTLLNDIWASLLGDMAAGRGLAVSEVQAAVDAEGVLLAESALENGLVDELAYRDEFLAKMRVEAGNGSDGAGNRSFRQISLQKYSRALRAGERARASGQKVVAEKKKNTKGEASEARKPRGRVAVLYGEGNIVDGRGGPGQIGGERFAQELRTLREDSRVSAIVLRVNSPGGSATASEAIQRELSLAAQAKPVVVSMGSVAASGGYWISTPAQRIFAEPVTVTGSIGVFGVFFNIEGFSEKLGLNFETVKTGRFADTGAINRPLTAAELAVAQRSVDWIYDKFIERVAEGRGLAPDFVHEIAQGRVWSGVEAQRLGLVDELGGLGEAIAYAAEAAGLEKGRYRVSEYPRPMQINEALTEFFEEFMQEGFGTARALKTNAVVRGFWQRAASELRALESYNDPQHVYARLPLTLDTQ